MAVQKGGIRLVVENYKQFTSQLDAASTSMKDLGKNAQASASEVSGSSVVIEQWTETIDTSNEAARGAVQSYTALGLAMSAVGAAGAKLLTTFGLQASRIEELEVLLEVTRKNAIYMAEAQGDMEKAASLSSAAVQEQVQGIRDLHLNGIVANQTVADLIRYNLDWTRSVELARLAQDAATFAMEDSSEAVKGLVHGIATLQPRILRTYGLMINLNEAYRKYAVANDVAVKDMSVMQRQQAAFQEVLALAPSIAGAYEAAMGTAAKQTRSLKTDIVNLAEAFGEEYTPFLDTAVGKTRDILRVLTELPDPMQAFIAYTTGAGTALSALTGGAALLIPRLAKMAQAFKDLAFAINVSKLALGTFIAAVPLLIGAIAYVREQEEAYEEEAAAILAASDSYSHYISALERAGLETRALTEDTYDLIKAKEEEEQQNLAKAMREAQVAIEGAAKALHGEFLFGIDAATASEESLVAIQEAWIDALKREIIPNLDEQQKALYSNVSAWRELLDAEGIAPNLAIDYARELARLTRVEIANAAATGEVANQTSIENELLIKTNERIREYTDAVQDAATVTPKWWKAIESLINYFPRMADMLETFAPLIDRANQKVVDAQIKRNRALFDLDREYQQKAEDAWIDYQRALADSEGDLAQFHAGTLQELLDLDRDYLQDRNDAWTKYQQDLEDAERELQRDIEDASRKRAQNLADLDREYAQDLEDARRDLAQDLEDAERDHQQRLEDIRRDRQESLLDMEEEYQQRLYDITNAGQQRLAELQEQYEEKTSDKRLEYARKAIERLEEMGWVMSEQWKKALIEAFRTGADPEILQTLAGGGGGAFADLFAEMLKEIEGLNEDLLWDQMDLSDDIQRDQERRLEDLDEWLAEERAAIEEAYQDRLVQEQERIALEREERQREYDDKLEELKLSRQREREEIELDHQRRLEDLRIQHEREREEALRDYNQRLEDLQIAYGREREAIRLNLEEQNEEARQKYDEALEDLRRAKEREREEINLQYARTKEDVARDLEDMVKEAAEKYDFLPEALKPTHARLKLDLHNLLVADPDSLTNQWTDFISNLQNNILQAHSPSRVFTRMGESIYAGVEQGVGNIGDLLTSSFDLAAFEANINSVLPAGRASMPMGMGAGSVTNSSTSNLNVTAQYQHQSEASLRDDLSLWAGMMRAWGR